MNNIDRYLLLLALVLLLFNVSGSIKDWQVSFGLSACRAAPDYLSRQLINDQAQGMPATKELSDETIDFLDQELEKLYEQELNNPPIVPEWAKPKKEK